MSMRKLIRLLPIACICAFMSFSTAVAQDTSITTVKKDGATTVTKTVNASQKTISDADGTTSTFDGNDTYVESVTKPNVSQTENGYEGGAARSHEESHVREATSGNAAEGDLGSTELQNGRTIGESSVGLHANASAENDFGSASASVDAQASAQARVGDNGAEASFNVGLSAELEAVSKKFEAGNENVGASAQASVKVEALIGAQGKLGAYIDEKGITFGVEARAGAYVSAQVDVNFEAHFFGIQVNVHAYAEGHAGALAHAEAVVTIGWDGKIKFKLGAGLSIGFGFSLGIEFEVDASQLLKQLHLPDLAALLEWIAKFQKDPSATIAELVDSYKQEVLDAVTTRVTEAAESIPIIGGIVSWFTQKPEETETSETQENDETSTVPPDDEIYDHTQPSTDTIRNGDNGESTKSGAMYNRQYEKWSE